MHGFFLYFFRVDLVGSRIIKKNITSQKMFSSVTHKSQTQIWKIKL
jgi:hypothetical protein